VKAEEGDWSSLAGIRSWLLSRQAWNLYGLKSSKTIDMV